MFKTISMQNFHQEMTNNPNKLHVIDVREPVEYEGGHVPSAVNMPLNTIPASMTNLDKNQPYHIICQSGGRSAMACEFLANEGYDVTNVEGGTGAWPDQLS